jgi:hypothetical protein
LKRQNPEVSSLGVFASEGSTEEVTRNFYRQAGCPIAQVQQKTRQFDISIYFAVRKEERNEDIFGCVYPKDWKSFRKCREDDWQNNGKNLAENWYL